MVGLEFPGIYIHTYALDPGFLEHLQRPRQVHDLVPNSHFNSDQSRENSVHLGIEKQVAGFLPVG